VTPANAMTLIQSLLGGGQAPQPQQQSSGMGGVLGSLLGGGQQQSQQGGGIGGVLGSLLGGGQQSQQGQQGQGGLDLGDLLQAGMAFMNTKQRGGGNLEAIVNAVVASSAMGGGYRQQSSNLVASTMMQAIKGMIR